MFCQTNYTDKSFFSANFLLEQCMNEPKCVWCEWVCLCTCFCQWNQIQEKQKKHHINTGRIGKLVIFLRALRLRMQIVWKFTKCEMNQRSLACLLGTDVELFFRLINKRKIIHKNIVHRFFFLHFPNTYKYVHSKQPTKQASKCVVAHRYFLIFVVISMGFFLVWNSLPYYYWSTPKKKKKQKKETNHWAKMTAFLRFDTYRLFTHQLTKSISESKSEISVSITQAKQIHHSWEVLLQRTFHKSTSVSKTQFGCNLHSSVNIVCLPFPFIHKIVLRKPSEKKTKWIECFSKIDRSQ